MPVIRWHIFWIWSLEGNDLIYESKQKHRQEAVLGDLRFDFDIKFDFIIYPKFSTLVWRKEQSPDNRFVFRRFSAHDFSIFSVGNC